MIRTLLRAPRDASRTGDEGFTLLELMVVVMIVGILAALAIPVFATAVDAARGSAVASAIANAKLALTTERTEQGSLPTGAGLASILTMHGDAQITISLLGDDDLFCLQGAHEAMSTSWASSSRSGVVQDATCSAAGELVPSAP